MASNNWTSCDSPFIAVCSDCGSALRYTPPDPASYDTEGAYSCARCGLVWRRMSRAWFKQSTRPQLRIVRGRRAA